jgi:cyclopropane-fatty-acyl-phospholipid synthase
MNVLLRRIVERLIRTGNLKMTGSDGKTHQFGDGTGEPVHVRFKTPHAERAVAMHPTLALPEAYMDGEVDVVEGGLLSFLRIAYENMGMDGINPHWTRTIEALRVAVRGLQQIHQASRSKRNVQPHNE